MALPARRDRRWDPRQHGPVSQIVAEHALLSAHASIFLFEADSGSVRLYSLRRDFARTRAFGAHSASDPIFRDSRDRARGLRSVAPAALVLRIFFPAFGSSLRIAER